MATPAAPASRPTEFSVGYRRYALGLLVVVYVFNFIDRQILSILLESIKRDLSLSDTQLGFLSGIAFALFYSTLGVPIARWADRSPRTRIIALAVFLWSALTAAQGLARNFAMLALARVGVGIGEAGCSPPAHSMLSDYFPPERRATALSVYALGIPIGVGFGYLLGGWLDQFFGWRAAFMVVGVPGLVLAALVRFTLREPTRGYWDTPGTASPRSESMRDVARFLLRLPSFRHFSLAAALHAFYGYGAASFNPVFFIRVHGFSLGELGSWLALIGFTAGGLGTFLGGYLGDRLASRDLRWYMWVPAAATLIGVPFVALLYLTPEPYRALATLSIPSLLGAMYLGPTFAMTQAIVPARMRALASAVLLLVINFVGLGLGPQFVGALSDWLAPRYGVDSIRLALFWVVSVGAVWSTLHYLLAARTLRRDLGAKESLEAEASDARVAGSALSSGSGG